MAASRTKLAPPGRPVLVCPDKFRGSLAAEQVAAAIASGLADAQLTADVCAIADGGEGTLTAVQRATDCELVELETCDALGAPLVAPVAVLGDGRSALVECAQAIGVERIAPAKRDAWSASSRGAGLLIAGAAELGVREVLVGIGGTASTDGGSGALEALREHDWPSPGKRAKGRSAQPKLIALCDVRAAWEQAATMFAPQKGADARTVTRLAKRLDTLAAELPQDPRGKLTAGAGGGLAGGLWAAHGAELKNGAAYVLDLLGFTARMQAARAVITGEGKLDRQTLLGKAVGEVATRARQSGVPCHALVGTNEMTEFDARILDFESVRETTDRRQLRAAARKLAAVIAAS